MAANAARCRFTAAGVVVSRSVLPQRRCRRSLGSSGPVRPAGSSRDSERKMMKGERCRPLLGGGPGYASRSLRLFAARQRLLQLFDYVIARRR